MKVFLGNWQIVTMIITEVMMRNKMLNWYTKPMLKNSVNIENF